MVKNLSIILAISLLVCVNAEAQDDNPHKETHYTEESLRESLRNAESEHSRKDRMIKYDEMHKLYRITKNKDRRNGSKRKTQEAIESKDRHDLKSDSIPKVESGAAQNIQKERDDKQKSESIESSIQKHETAAPLNFKKNNRGPARFQKDRYIPPSWSVMSNTGGFGVDQVKKNGPYFGIRMGTRIYGEIRRPVTNAERNHCEIHVTKDVVGDVATIEEGAILFAAKEFNSSTKLLEIRTVRGITKGGDEFVISAYGMDIHEVAGLAGTITTDGQSGKRSLSKGGFEAGRAIASAINTGSVVGAGVEAAANNMLSEKEIESEQEIGGPQYIIRVEPQQVILMVEKTF